MIFAGANGGSVRAGPLEQDRLIARSIPRAKFVTLESDNHVVLAGEPAWPRLISEIAAFLAE